MSLALFKKNKDDECQDCFTGTDIFGLKLTAIFKNGYISVCEVVQSVSVIKSYNLMLAAVWY